MERTIAVTAILVTFGVVQNPRPAGAPARPQQWVSFAADTVITSPGRPDQPGRYLQDEHGCTRREIVDPDGSPQITINNHDQGRVYSLLRGTWTARSIRTGMPRLPPTNRNLLRKIEPIDGYEVYETEVNIRSPQGDRKEVQAVVPALNFLTVRMPMPSGRLQRVVAIRPGPQSPDDFVPPASAAVVEDLGSYAGGISWAIVLRVTFVGQEKPLELTTTEGQPTAVKSPDGEISLVTMLVEGKQDVVGVRVLKDARRSGFMKVTGDELDVVEVPLGGLVSTTKLPVNMTIMVTRIGSRFARPPER